MTDSHQPSSDHPHMISMLPNRLQLCTLPRNSLPYLSHFLISHIFFSGQGIPSQVPAGDHLLHDASNRAFANGLGLGMSVSTVSHSTSHDTSPRNSVSSNESLSREFISISINDFEVSVIMTTQAINRLPSNFICPGLDICPDTFRALQIDDDGITQPGERIKRLAKPLAFEGISIFYLSTYQTDLVFVKEKRMPLVISTLCKEGFLFLDLEQWNQNQVLMTPDSMGMGPSPGVSQSATAPIESAGDDGQRPQLLNAGLSVDTNVESIADQKPSDTTSQPPLLIAPKSAESCVSHAPPDVNSLSKVLLHGTRLQLVGLNHELQDEWALTLLKVLFFSNHASSTATDHDRAMAQFLSFTVTEEGVSMVADVNVLEEFPDRVLHKSLDPVALKCIQVDVTTLGLDRYGIVYSMANQLVSADVNLLYLSTLRTANVLVKEEDLSLALERLNMSL